MLEALAGGADLDAVEERHVLLVDGTQGEFQLLAGPRRRNLDRFTVPDYAIGAA